MIFNVALISSICFALLLACAHGSSIQKTVGDTVTIQCNLEEAYPSGAISWLIEWDNGETIEIDAKKSVVVEGRGNYETFYSSIKGFITVTHQCKLIITDVKAYDQGHFKCEHDGYIRNRGTFSSVYLEVEEPREGSPECSFETDNDQSLELTTGSLVNLQCELEGETLTWYDGNGTIIPTGSKLNENMIEYTLRDTDNGANLVCKSGSTEEDYNECRVTPFAKLPNVTITPLSEEVILDVSNTANFTCCGQGIPSISRYEWIFNGSSVGTGNRFRVSLSGTCETLHVLHLTQDDNITQVLCEVSTSKGLSASAVAMVIVLENQDRKGHSTPQTTTTNGRAITTNKVTPIPPFQTEHARTVYSSETLATTTQQADQPLAPSKSPQQSNLIIPIGISVAFIAVVIIIAIIVFVMYRLRNHTHRSTGFDSSKHQTSHTAFTMPDLIYQDNMPVKEQGNNNSRETANERNSSRNVEGLTYASLDLNTCADEDEILHPSADEAVMYVDVRTS